ncbi:hypothetical protein CONLIGDRAFT_628820, partial [Coniochaeta ligniaria NRRL 30616]
KAKTLFATLSFENDKAKEILRQNRIDRLTSILKAFNLVLKTNKKRRKEKEIKDSPEISSDRKFDDMLAYMLTN